MRMDLHFYKPLLSLCKAEGTNKPGLRLSPELSPATPLPARSQHSGANMESLTRTHAKDDFSAKCNPTWRALTEQDSMTQSSAAS